MRGLPEVSFIIVQTPHHMCDASLDGHYRLALSDTNISHSEALCAAHLVPNTALTWTQAHDICAAGSFTGANTAKLAARVRTVWARLASLSSAAGGAPLGLVDSHLMTASLSNCSEATEDGRHYFGNILIKEVTALHAYLSAQQLWLNASVDWK